MNQFWQKEFGYGIEQLTQSEARHVYAAANVDAIRSRISQARLAAGIGVGRERVDAPRTIDEELISVIAALQTKNPDAILRMENPLRLAVVVSFWRSSPVCRTAIARFTAKTGANKRPRKRLYRTV